MNTFAVWAFREVYSNQKSENRLLQIVDIIVWKPIRELLEEMCKNKSENGGRPNCDALMMFRILILEEWYGLSDLEVARQIKDRVSFMGFLGFPKQVPDSSTVWLFKERMIETGTHDRVWDDFRRQLDSKGLTVKRGTIQDATFIEADPGSSKKPWGDQAKTRRSRDGTWTKKGDEFHFGYKLYSKVYIDYALIREIDTTMAKVQDSRVDRSIPGEVVLRDKGYFGVPARSEDFTMKRRTTEKPLDDLENERNRLISNLRSPGERPFAVIKRVFGAGRVLVTTLKRVYGKMIVEAISYNLYQLQTLKKPNVI